MDPGYKWVMNWQVLTLNFYKEEKKVADFQETIQIKDRKHCQHLFSLHLGIKERYVWKYAKHVRSSKGLKVT